jgi:hypothetical protein
VRDQLHSKSRLISNNCCKFVLFLFSDKTFLHTGTKHKWAYSTCFFINWSRFVTSSLDVSGIIQLHLLLNTVF